MRPLEAMESDIARISNLNERFDDVDRAGSGIAMFRYVMSISLTSGSTPAQPPGKGTGMPRSKALANHWKSTIP